MNFYKPTTKTLLLTPAEISDSDILNALIYKARKYFPKQYASIVTFLKDQFAQFTKSNHFITAEMQVIIIQIHNCKLKPPLKTLYIDSKIYELLLLVYNKIFSEQNNKIMRLSSYDNERLQKVKSIILDNLDHPYTIQELARKACINECKLKKGFKQLYGTSVYSFLRDERMKRSIELLQQDDLSIQAIALELGFPYLSAFTNAFCNKFGFPPTYFRKHKYRI